MASKGKSAGVMVDMMGRATNQPVKPPENTMREMRGPMMYPTPRRATLYSVPKWMRVLSPTWNVPPSRPPQRPRLTVPNRVSRAVAMRKSMPMKKAVNTYITALPLPSPAFSTSAAAMPSGYGRAWSMMRMRRRVMEKRTPRVPPRAAMVITTQ